MKQHQEEEKTHYQIIEEIVGQKMYPIYWIIGVPIVLITTMFFTVALPIAAKVIDNTEEITKKVNSDEAYENFLPKKVYHSLQKDEHVTDLDALRNPQDADLIYLKHNNVEAERLDIATRSVTPYLKKSYDNATKN